MSSLFGWVNLQNVKREKRVLFWALLSSHLLVSVVHKMLTCDQHCNDDTQFTRFLFNWLDCFHLILTCWYHGWCLVHSDHELWWQSLQTVGSVSLQSVCMVVLYKFRVLRVLWPIGFRWLPVSDYVSSVSLFPSGDFNLQKLWSFFANHVSKWNNTTTPCKSFHMKISSFAAITINQKSVKVSVKTTKQLEICFCSVVGKTMMIGKNWSVCWRIQTKNWFNSILVDWKTTI